LHQWPFQEPIYWRYLPYIKPIFHAYGREYPEYPQNSHGQKIATKAPPFEDPQDFPLIVAVYIPSSPGFPHVFPPWVPAPHPPAQVDKLSKQVDNTKAELHLQQGNLSQRQGAQGGLFSVLEWDI